MATDSELLRTLLERYFALAEDGVQTDLETLCAEAPHLRPRVAELLERERDLMVRIGKGQTPSAASAETIGGYRLLECIGRGGMGEVWRAYDSSLDRDIALKIVEDGGGRTSEQRRRLRREAEIAAALDHPAIVPIYAVGEDTRRTWIAMKLLSGPSLAGAAGTLEPPTLARFGAAVARALHDAHLEGVIHRDVKPANIVIDGDRVYLVDFGLARLVLGPGLTSPKVVPGTLAYMPPEQVRGAPEPRSDVYALCASLYEALVGRPPFPHTDPEALIKAILEDEVGMVAGLPRDFMTVLLRGLQKEPSARFLSAAELADDLDRFAAGKPVKARPISTTERAARLVRRHPIAAVAVVLTILGWLGTWLWFGADARARAAADADHLVRATAAAERGDFGLAGALIDDVRSRAPEAAGLAVAGQRLVALESLQRALEIALCDHGVTVLETEAAKELVRRADVRATRRPLPDLLALILEIRLGNRARALVDLAALEASFGRSATTTALRAAVGSGRIRPSDLPPFRRLGPEVDDIDDGLLTLVGFRLAGASIDDRERVFTPLFVRSPERFGVMFTRGVLHHDAGRFELAYEAFLGALTERTHRRAVILALVTEAYLAGRTDLATMHLEALPLADRGGNYERRFLETMERVDPETFATRLMTHLERHPDDGWALMRRASLALGDGRNAEALLDARRAVALCNEPRDRATARLIDLYAEVAAEGMPIGRLGARPDEDELDVFGAAVRKAKVLESEAPDDAARSDVRLLEARLALSLGRNSDAWGAIALALADDPRNPGVAVTYAAMTAHDIAASLAAGSAARLSPEAPAEAASRTQELAEALAARPPGGTRVAVREQVISVLENAVVAATALNDLGAFKAAEERLRAYAGGIPESFARDLESLRAVIGASR